MYRTVQVLIACRGPIFCQPLPSTTHRPFPRFQEFWRIAQAKSFVSQIGASTWNEPRAKTAESTMFPLESSHFRWKSQDRLSGNKPPPPPFPPFPPRLLLAGIRERQIEVWISGFFLVPEVAARLHSIDPSPLSPKPLDRKGVCDSFVDEKDAGLAGFDLPVLLFQDLTCFVRRDWNLAGLGFFLRSSGSRKIPFSMSHKEAAACNTQLFFFKHFPMRVECLKPNLISFGAKIDRTCESALQTGSVLQTKILPA